MIQFSCRCSHPFELADDMAGGLIQCPACGRLNDVPTLGDLPHLDADGAYAIEVDRPQDNPYRLAELGIIYAKGRRDAEGDEIDLRFGAAEVEPAAAGPVPVEPVGPIAPDDERPGPGPLRVSPPRYDPETGELIRPLDLKTDGAGPGGDPVAAIPVAKPALNYATPELNRRVGAGRMMFQLFAPGNLAVMGFILLAHLLLQLTTVVVVSGLYFLIVAPLVLFLLIVSHYGNVVEDTGPKERDELPAPLRECSWYEDVWLPMIAVLGSAFLSALPFIALLALDVPWAGCLAAAVIGVALYPAVLLTMVTSGTALNLRPDRVAGVIGRCGGGYVVSVLLLLAALVTYFGGILVSELALAQLFRGGSLGSSAVMWLGSYPLMMVGIYLMHGFCWHLGLMYRAHQHAFPWILQYHIQQRARTQGGPPTGPAAAAGDNQPRPPADTKAKLRALREAERRRAKAPGTRPGLTRP